MEQLDCFYHFRYVFYRTVAPTVDPVLAAFFGAVANSERDTDLPPFDAKGPVLILTKNIYRLRRLFPVGANLVCDNELAIKISSVASVNTRPAIIRSAFDFPYEAGNGDYMKAKCFRDSPHAEAIVARFEKAHKCDVPDTVFREIVCRTQSDVQDDHSDWRDFIISGHETEGQSHQKISVSKSSLIKHGIIRAYGYQCSEPVFRLLEPYLEFPFFFTKKFLL